MTGVSRYAGVWINDERFSESAVEDPGKTVGKIKKEVSQEKEVQEVLVKGEDFDQSAEHFPDLIVAFDKDVKADTSLRSTVRGEISSYMHADYGYLGTDIESFSIGDEEVQLRHLAPMILHLQGRKIPSWMDEKIPSVFENSSRPGRREVSVKQEETLVDDLDI